ncbi:hypothetical protein OESDEN_04023 [Oesophagostomum dentatum]|uniref:Uncharacterized protein n=1 Tax=Oesophagostomum dentatum TaxID=61180 RepID=A0A0B1TFI3_OESDE|nr:hypothetical protein OESDEN_04023 [Oesophagostomum dentatum]
MTDTNSGIFIPEDIAHIIVKHMMDELHERDDFYTNWLNLRSVSRSFYKAIQRFFDNLGTISVYNHIFDDVLRVSGVCGSIC